MLKPDYERDGVKLYRGDCLEILPQLERVDAIVTDPPYGIGEHGGASRTRSDYSYRKHENLGWDKERPRREAFDLMRKISDHQLIFGGNYFADYLPPTQSWLYWRKLMGGDFADGELVWTSLNRALREFTYCPKGMNKKHPTEKPIELMSWCLYFLPDAQTILDPFMGSGTTGVACIRTGRKFIGIEIEPKYFDIAVRRIEQAFEDTAMFREVEKEKQLELLSCPKEAK